MTSFESRVKNPQEFGKNSDVKAKKKKQGTVKDIEENEKQAELKWIWMECYTRNKVTVVQTYC